MLNAPFDFKKTLKFRHDVGALWLSKDACRIVRWAELIDPSGGLFTKAQHGPLFGSRTKVAVAGAVCVLGALCPMALCRGPCLSRSSYTGSGRRLRILRQAAAGHAVFGTQLLRRVRQCRSHDERGRDSHVLLPGRSRRCLSVCLSLSCTPVLLAKNSTDSSLVQILKPADKKLYSYGGGGGMGSGRPVTPPRNSAKGGKAKK